MVVLLSVLFLCISHTDIQILIVMFVNADNTCEINVLWMRYSTLVLSGSTRTSSTRTRRGGSCLRVILQIRPFSSIELACAVRHPGPCVRDLCEPAALLLFENMTCARPRCNAMPSEHFLCSSHYALRTPHFTLHTSHFALHTSSHLTSSQLFSSHPISSHMSSK